MLSNANKVGFAVSTSATSPTFAFLTTEPVYFEFNKPRYLYEESGYADSSYSDQYVEQRGSNTIPVKAYLTQSMFFRIITELMNASGTPSGAGTSAVQPLSRTTAAYTAPSHGVLREIAMFFSDGTTNSRCNASIFSATITGEADGMVMVELQVGIHSMTTTSITYPTSFNEAEDSHKYSTMNTTLAVSGISVPVQADVRNFSVTLDSGIADLTRKLGNTYRAEGGSRSAMISFESTFSSALRTLWRNSTPAKGVFTLTIGSNTTGIGSLEIVLSNMVLNERTVQAPLNEITTESTTFTSAPLSVTAEITNYTAGQIIVT